MTTYHSTIDFNKLLTQFFLDSEKTLTSDKNFLNRFSTLLPVIDEHFRFKTQQFFDAFGDEYYDEFRTPAQAIQMQTIHSILKSSEEDGRKRQLLTELLKTGKISDQQQSQQLIAPTDQREAKEALLSEDKKSELVKAFKAKSDEHDNEAWKVVTKITQFYHNAQTHPEELNQWNQLLTNQLFDGEDAFSAKLPRKIIKDFAELMQALAEIDPNAVKVFQSYIAQANQCLGNDTKAKIESVFKLLQRFLVSDSTKNAEAKSNEEKSQKTVIASIQEQELERIKKKEEQDIRYLYLFYMRDKTREEQGNGSNNQVQIEPTEVFKNYCYHILYGDAFDDKTNIGLTPRNLYFLKRDLKYLFVKDDLVNQRKQAQKRIQKIAGLVSDLSAYCGCECPISAYQAPQKPEDSKSPYVNRNKFLQSLLLYQAASPPKENQAWKRYATDISRQKARNRSFISKFLGNFLAQGLAAGEGTVASVGNYQFLVGISPVVASATLVPTLIGSAGCNYATVHNDTVDTLDTLFQGLSQLHYDENGNRLSNTRIALLWLFSLLPSAISGACYGALGGLSASTTLAVILGFAGVSMIPVVGWALFGLVALVTFCTIFAILFLNTSKAIKTAQFEDIEDYFKVRFYWPTNGSIWDKTKALVNNVFSGLRLMIASIVVVGLLFITGLKLFTLSLVGLFGGSAAATQAASGMAYVNSTLWAYFNFRKGSVLLDLITPRGFMKLITYPIEIGIRTIIFIVPAVVCLIGAGLLYFFADKQSKQCYQGFEWCLDQMAPHFFSKLWNKCISGRTHSGVDESLEDQKPVQIVGGIVKSTFALLKLTPYIPEIAGRALYGLLYNCLYPIRKITNVISRVFGCEFRFKEKNLTEILVPHGTKAASNWLRSKLEGIRHWIHEKRGIKLSSEDTLANTIKTTRDIAKDSAAIAVIGNGVGQGAIFAENAAQHLPPFIQPAVPGQIAKDLAAGAPQAICSIALNNSSCKAMLNAQGYEPLSLVEEGAKSPEVIGKELFTQWKDQTPPSSGSGVGGSGRDESSDSNDEDEKEKQGEKQGHPSKHNSNEQQRDKPTDSELVLPAALTINQYHIVQSQLHAFDSDRIPISSVSHERRQEMIPEAENQSAPVMNLAPVPIPPPLPEQQLPVSGNQGQPIVTEVVSNAVRRQQEYYVAHLFTNAQIKDLSPSSVVIDTTLQCLPAFLASDADPTKSSVSDHLITSDKCLTAAGNHQPADPNLISPPVTVIPNLSSFKGAFLKNLSPNNIEVSDGNSYTTAEKPSYVASAAV